MSDYRIALICGLAPLATGITVFILWLMTGWDELKGVGLLVLVCGSLMFVGGISALVSYVGKPLQDRALRRSVIKLKALLALGILLVNFPVAYGIIHVVVGIEFPRVPTDWVKARSYEFIRYGADGVEWPRIGEGRWYYKEYRFGIRLFASSKEDWALIFAPDGDGPRAYVLLPDHRIGYSPDDAMSVGCSWGDIDRLRSENFHRGNFNGWLEVK